MYSTTRSEILDKLAYMMGGRAAEEMVFHDPTTGASNDIEKATALARAMVTQYGMTEKLGAIQLGKDNSEPFLGRDMGHSRNYSEDVAAIVDEETKKLLANAHQEAFDILVENRDVLDHLVLELLEKETLDKEQVEQIFAPIKKRFDNLLARRRGQIAALAAELLATPATAPRCAAAERLPDGSLSRCAAPGTTAIAGRPFCDRHAARVPRLPVPA